MWTVPCAQAVSESAQDGISSVALHRSAGVTGPPAALPDESAGQMNGRAGVGAAVVVAIAAMVGDGSGEVAIADGWVPVSRLRAEQPMLVSAMVSPRQTMIHVPVRPSHQGAGR